MVEAASSNWGRVMVTRSAWQQKGSVPGLVKLLKAFLSHDAKSIVESGQITQVLGVIQQRLIPSKINDGWGFELLQSVVQYLPACVRCLYLPGLASPMLTTQTHICTGTRSSNTSAH